MGRDPTAERRIVVPIDGSAFSEAAIPFAAALSGPGVELHLVRVIPPAEAIEGIWGAVVATEAQVREMTEQEAAEDIERALRAAAPLHAQVVAHVVAGDPADQIIQTAIRLDAEMIVMASHGRGAFGRWTLGSVADRVARGSLIPVTIICPEPGEAPVGVGLRRVVVAIDGSVLSHQALPVARDLARQHGVPALLLQAINPAALDPGLAASDGKETRVEPLLGEEQLAVGNLTEAERQLRAAGIAVTTSVRTGPAVPAIKSAVEPGDVIVITSHGRGGVRRWLLGSVAERLIRSGVAPIVVVPAAERQPLRKPGLAQAVKSHAAMFAPAREMQRGDADVQPSSCAAGWLPRR